MYLGGTDARALNACVLYEGVNRWIEVSKPWAERVIEWLAEFRNAADEPNRG
jgi:hypothetical protein